MVEKRFESNLLNDLTFKKLFASEETKEITRYFLKEVAGIEVKEVTLRPTEVYTVKKLADLAKENDVLRTKVDLLVDLDNGQLATIELQNKFQVFFSERALLYMSKGYLTSYNEADTVATAKYSSLRSIYGVNILNFNLHPIEYPDEVMRYELRNRKYGITLRNHRTKSDLWTLIFFELPKVNTRSSQILQEWKALFLTGKVSEDAPEHLKKAADFIAFENLGEEERQMYINFDEHEAIREAELEGALEQGREQGLELGGERKAIQIASSMLHENYSLETIAKLTGLSISTLKKIQDEETYYQNS